MLQRISADRFETAAGQKVQLVLRSSQNNGITSGAFHYAGEPLAGETIQGRPGCSFVPVAGVQQFRVHVDFDPAAADGRYDIFEIDPDNGSEVDLQKSRLASDFDAIIGFGIKGTMAMTRSAAPKAFAIPIKKRAVAKKPKIAKAAKKPRSAKKAKRAQKAAATRKVTATKKPKAPAKKRPATRVARKTGRRRAR